MTLTQSDIDEAVQRLDRGLELVVTPTTAAWQKEGRRSLRFPVDRTRARCLQDALSDRFRMRHPPSRHVLTTEPVDQDEVTTSDTDPSHLYRHWHTTKEIALIVGSTYDAIRQCLDRYRDSLTIETMAGHGQPRIVRSDEQLQRVLRTVYGDPVPIRIDETLETRTPLPHSVVLEQDVYTTRELGHCVGRSYGPAAEFLLKHEELLVLTTRKDPTSGVESKAVCTDAALATAMAEYWDLDEVTIAPSE